MHVANVALFRWDKCEARLGRELQPMLAPGGGFDTCGKRKVWPQLFFNKKPPLKNAVSDEEPNLFEDLLQYIHIIYKRSFAGKPACK